MITRLGLCLKRQRDPRAPHGDVQVCLIEDDRSGVEELLLLSQTVFDPLCHWLDERDLLVWVLQLGVWHCKHAGHLVQVIDRRQQRAFLARRPRLLEMIDLPHPLAVVNGEMGLQLGVGNLSHHVLPALDQSVSSVCHKDFVEERSVPSLAV